MHTTTILMLHVAPLLATLTLSVACSREAEAGKDNTSAASPSAPDESGARASIHVEVSGLRSSEGTVHAYLYGSADGFPNGLSKAAKHGKTSALSGNTASLDFENLVPGDYAVFVFHDENGNGELDKSLIGFPQEGIGVSNLKLDKPQRPKWSAAKFEVRGPTSQRISLRYL